MVQLFKPWTEKLSSFTTGNRDFAECKILCRVSKIGHSAKNCTRQKVLCRVPDTRQTMALDKGLLCRVPDSRQNLYTRHRLPVNRRPATAFFAERLRLGTRQRFVFFLFLISLPSAPDLALGKDLNFFFKFFTERLRSGARQRKFFIFKILCRVPPGRHSAKI